MSDALVAQDLSVTRGKRTVVDGISLRARYGSVLAVVGPNGAGKSSLVRALAGLLPYSGTVQIEGRNLHELKLEERARRIAWVPQQSLIQADLSVSELVGHGRFAFARSLFGLPARREPAIERALEVTDVAHLRERSFSRLSGGEQRRVLIARALATEARILLLDEPTAGLDVAHVLRTHQLLKDLARAGSCVVCVLHDLADVERHADQVALLSAGKLVSFAKPAEALSEPHLRDVYGVRKQTETSSSFQLVEPTP